MAAPTPARPAAPSRSLRSGGLNYTYLGGWDGGTDGHCDTFPVAVNAGDILVAVTMADSYRDLSHAAVTMTWPDTRGFPHEVENAFWGNSYDGAYVKVSAYRCPTSGNPGVHTLVTGSAVGHRRASLDLWTISGADVSTFVAGTGTRDASGNPMNVTLRSAGDTGGSTIAIIAGADGASAGTPHVSGSGIDPGDGFTQPSGGGEAGICAFSASAEWANPNADQSLIIDPAGGSMAFQAVAWMEFQGPRVPPEVDAGVDTSYTFGSNGGVFTRTASEVPNGTIVYREWVIQSGPAGVGPVLSFGQTVNWSPTVAGVYVLRYAAVNPIGEDVDTVTVTVVGVVPVVDASVDRTVERTTGLIRTAGESSDGGSAITARQWRLMSGPAGSGAPVDLAAYGGDPKRCLLPSSVAGAHVIRYTATNATGAGFDEATITVTPLRPTVNAGPDAAVAAGVFTRTATEVAGDSAITSRKWIIQAGVAGVGSTIGSAAALSWTPPSLGQWTLRYTATSAAGTSDPDDCVITVGVSGMPLVLGRTPEPKLAVTLAFAGDLTDPSGASWGFTEVTSDVRAAQGVHLRHGRSDEASTSQPATCQFTLNNRHGRYSLGGRSPYWPNVRQGVPCQAAVDLGGGFGALFTGSVDGFTPSYSINPLTGEVGDATVTVVASGALRRLSQGTPPVVSPLKRSLLVASGVVAYWPCEDDKSSTNLASAFPGHPPMEYVRRLHPGGNPNAPAAAPRPAASDVFACSLPLPLISDSEWYGNVVPYTPTNVLQLHFLLQIPDAGTNTDSVLIGLINTGDPWMWEIRYRSATATPPARNGQINIRAWKSLTGLVEDRYITFGVDGALVQFGLTLTRNGANVDYQLDMIEVGSTVGYTYNNTVTTATLGMATRVQTATDGGHFDVTMGHINLRTVAWNMSEHMNFVNARSGDPVGTRLAQVTSQALLGLTMLDAGGTTSVTAADYMGPQRSGTVVQLLRDCEKVDGGTLWDGETPGITYTTKRYRESRTPTLTLDAARGEVAVPFAPVHDDAGRVNRAQANRRDGGSAAAADYTGPLGANIVGRYDDGREFDCRDDLALPHYASWMVAQGTAEGYRYPRLALDLRAHPELLDEWQAVSIGDRIDVLNLSAVNPSAPVESISLVVEGYEQTITPRTWSVVMNTSLAQRWAVAQCCAATTGGSGDPRAEYAGRYDTSGTSIAVLCTASQQSLTVTTPSGPLWTTAADDYPLYLDIGAVQVRATACTAGGVSGNATWQTFTTEPLPVSRPAGTAVQLWQSPVLGL